MANLNVQASSQNTTVTVQDANNILLNIAPPTEISVQLTPPPTQIVQINRGVQGPSGDNIIGGYPVVITGAKNFDALMFQNNSWVNTPQTEIADGGNF